MMSRSGRKDILVLPSWYPTKINPDLGDFVKRHVEAISNYTNQHVIHILRDEKGVVTKSTSWDRHEYNGYSEEIIYYYVHPSKFAWLDRLRSSLIYNKLSKDACTEYIRLNGLPACVHVHVTMKAGMTALWLKRKFKIPFILTEHWSGYYQQEDDNFFSRNIIFRTLSKKVMTSASKLTVVSSWLGHAIKAILPGINFIVIPNVVDTKVFFPIATRKPYGKFRFIHASSMNYAKNAEGILAAISLLKTYSSNFELYLYGSLSPQLERRITESGLAEYVIYKGLVDQAALATEMQQADAFIINSRFETFGCVIIEANACGLPVLAPDIPVFHELITEENNGAFFDAESPEAIAKKMYQYIQGDIVYSPEKIKEMTHRYAYEKVGDEFDRLYKEVTALNNDPVL